MRNGFVRAGALIVSAAAIAVATWVCVHSGPAPLPTHDGAAATAGDAASSRSEDKEKQAAPQPAAAERSHAASTNDLVEFPIQVVDAEGQPIAGVRVSTLDETPAAIATTGDDGWCSLLAPSHRATYALRAEFEHRHTQVLLARTDRVIKLPWAGPLRGRILDLASGEPIANVVVTHDHIECERCAPEVVQSNDNGTFVLPSVPRGHDVTLRFGVAGYARQTHERRLPGRGDPIDCEFRLSRGVAIQGQLLDDTSRSALAGAEVATEGALVCKSDEHGRFSLRARTDSDGSATFEVTAAGYCLHQFRLPAKSLQKPVGAHVLTMVASTQISGRVCGGKGQPIPDAQIRARWWGRSSVRRHNSNCQLGTWGQTITTKTDKQGRFAINELVPNASYWLYVEHDDFLDDRTEKNVDTAATRKGKEVMITLRAKAAVHGRATVAGSYRYNGRLRRGNVHWQAAGRYGQGLIEHDGTFRLADVPAGAVRIQAIPEGFENCYGEFAKALIPTRNLQLEHGQMCHIDFDHRTPEAEIAGQVTHEDGEPAVNRIVKYYAGHSPILVTQTDSEGRYTLLAPTAIETAYAYCADAEPWRQPARPGDRGVDFLAREQITLRYRFTDPSGRVLTPELLVRRSDEVHWSGHSIDSAAGPGGFRELRLDKGEHQIVAGVRGLAPFEQTVQFDRPTELDGKLKPGVTVTVRLAPGAEAPKNAHVMLEDLFENESEREVISDSSMGVPAMPKSTFRYAIRQIRFAGLNHDGRAFPHVGPGLHRLESYTCDLIPNTVAVGSHDVTVEVHVRKKAR